MTTWRSLYCLPVAVWIMAYSTSVSAMQAPPAEPPPPAQPAPPPPPPVAPAQPAPPEPPAPPAAPTPEPDPYAGKEDPSAQAPKAPALMSSPQPAQPAPTPGPAPFTATPPPSAQPSTPPAAPTTTPSPPPYDPNMQAGGLAPPPPMQTPTTQPQNSTTTQQLDEAKEKDSERGLEWVWLNFEGGFQQVGLSTFTVDVDQFTAGFVETSESGGMIGAGLGLRLLFLTLGPRARVGFFSAWQLFSIGGELGIHIPLGSVEPYFDFGFGYTGLGSFSDAIGGAANAISISGYDARIGGGLDVYVTSVFSVGAHISFEFLGLTRPGVSVSQIQNIKNNQDIPDAQRAKADLLALDGSSYGSALTISGVAGLHF